MTVMIRYIDAAIGCLKYDLDVKHLDFVDELNNYLNELVTKDIILLDSNFIYDDATCIYMIKIKKCAFNTKQIHINFVFNLSDITLIDFYIRIGLSSNRYKCKIALKNIIDLVNTLCYHNVSKSQDSFKLIDSKIQGFLTT